MSVTVPVNDEPPLNPGLSGAQANARSIQQRLDEKRQELEELRAGASNQLMFECSVPLLLCIFELIVLYQVLFFLEGRGWLLGWGLAFLLFLLLLVCVFFIWRGHRQRMRRVKSLENQIPSLLEELRAENPACQGDRRQPGSGRFDV